MVVHVKYNLVFFIKWHLMNASGIITIATIFVIMAALCNSAGHYIFPCGFFFYLSLFSISLSFSRLISAVADWMSAILPHMVWP